MRQSVPLTLSFLKTFDPNVVDVCVYVQFLNFTLQYWIYKSDSVFPLEASGPVAQFRWPLYSFCLFQNRSRIFLNLELNYTFITELKYSFITALFDLPEPHP